MDVLLRELRDDAGGIAAYRDTEITAKEVSIGCAPDQQIQLIGRGVGARHARIKGGARRPSLVCLHGLRAAVNGKERASARLDIGDTVEIGGHRLTLVQAPAGFDLAIELRMNAKIDSSEFEAAFRTDLQQTWLSRRGPARLVIGLLVLFGFAVPLAYVKTRRMDGPLPRWVPAWLSGWVPTQLGAWAAESFRPAPDAFWSTGPLSPGHQQLLGQRCVACHQTLFEHVQDGACRDCHKNTADHVLGTRLAQTSLGGTQRCAGCHHEHDEPRTLVARTDNLCVDCHANAPSSFGALKGQAVSGFGTGRHPLFASPGQLAAKGESGLTFWHAQHLNADRVRKSGDSSPLACADCHRLSADGEYFEPTTMAGNCASCHELTFDPDVPDRQLPHGNPREVVRTLQDYFVRKLSEPKAVQRPARERRRLPGHEDQNVVCKATLFVCAMQSAFKEVQFQFQRRGCVGCHQVTDTGKRDLAARFEVVPIELLRDYFPAARFPHRSHLVQGQLTGDQACLFCHPAQDAQASELLLPDLPTCEGCHSDAPDRDRTRLQCVSCHAYHPHS